MDEVAEVEFEVGVAIAKSTDDTGEEYCIVTGSNLRCRSSSCY
jgi:hypothetical protein